jgi:hypothetical protein
VIQAPLGTTTISGLSMDNTSVAGVVIRNTGAFDAHNTEAVAVILKNYTPKRVNNPLVVQADIGDLELHLSGLKSARDDSTSGTLITADVSGKAIVNAWLNSLDWARIGQGTGLLDWTYRDDSEGVVRIHETTAEFRDPGSNPEPTSLSFRTRDTSRGALVLSMVEFSWTTPVFLDAYDTSLMKVRLDQYLKAPDPAKKKFDPFEFHLSAHDRANIFSRINNYKGAAVYNSYASGLPTIPVHPLTGGFFIWRSDLGAVQRIERATDIAIDNPYSMTAWFGFDNDGNEASQTRPDWALADMPRNYIDDTLDSLDIPNP